MTCILGCMARKNAVAVACRDGGEFVHHALLFWRIHVEMGRVPDVSKLGSV